MGWLGGKGDGTGAVLEINGKERLVQRLFDIVKERRLLLRPDRVERPEPQPRQPVHVHLAREARRDLLRAPDGLVGHRQPAHGDGIHKHAAARVGAVAVADAPAVPAQLLGAGRLVGRVRRLPLQLRDGHVVGKDPEVRRARVEVEPQGLRGGADDHGRDVGRVHVVDGDGGGAAGAAPEDPGAAGGGRGGEHGADEVVRGGGAIFEVGFEDGEGAVELVGWVADLLDRDLAGAELLGLVVENRVSNLGGERQARGRDGEGGEEPEPGGGHGWELSWGSDSGNGEDGRQDRLASPTGLSPR